MASQLREAGVALNDRVVAAIAASPERVAALRQRDFRDQDSAFGHILRIARAQTLTDGSPASPLAAELFSLAGAPTGGATLDTGAARTSQAILTRHHAGEFSRIIADLALTRQVTLAGGNTVNWVPNGPAPNLMTSLWTALHGALASAAVPQTLMLGGQPISVLGQQAELANLATRLTGRPFVNVPGAAALPHLNPTLDTFGPLPARFGDFDGNVLGSAVALVSPDGAPLRLVPGLATPVEAGDLDLGFTTVPASLARAQHLPVAQYPAPNAGYAVAYPAAANGPAPQPSSRTPSAQEMVELMRQRGIDVPHTVTRDLARSPARVAALHQLDSQGRSTALEHILRLADAGTLRDGAPSPNMARDLFELAGATRGTTAGRCYARTSHAIFSMHHAGEFSRLLSELALGGEATLADGSVLRWDPQRMPVNNGQHVDWLWAGVAHAARLQIPPPGGLIELTGDLARDGEMANLHTRLSGVPHVNVAGRPALPHLQEIVSRYGPMLAEYGAHGGSVARVENGQAFSQEAGMPGPTPAGGNLGYVVVPREEANARGLPALQYPGQITGYIGSLSEEDFRRLRDRQRMEQPGASAFSLRWPNNAAWRNMHSAANFIDLLPTLPPGILEHHVRRGDFAAWAEHGLRRPTLAVRIRAIEAEVRGGLTDWERVRAELTQAIWDDYREPAAAAS
jgi:hypothetical protein